MKITGRNKLSTRRMPKCVVSESTECEARVVLCGGALVTECCSDSRLSPLPSATAAAGLGPAHGNYRPDRRCQQ